MPPRLRLRIEQSLTSAARQYRLALDPLLVQRLARHVAAELQRPVVDPPPVEIPSGAGLTTAQVALLRHRANGLDLHDIARLERASQPTLKSRQARVLELLGCRDITQAVAVAMALGLVDAGEVRVPVGTPRRKAGPKRVSA